MLMICVAVAIVMYLFYRTYASQISHTLWTVFTFIVAQIDRRVHNTEIIYFYVWWTEFKTSYTFWKNPRYMMYMYLNMHSHSYYACIVNTLRALDIFYVLAIFRDQRQNHIDCKHDQYHDSPEFSFKLICYCINSLFQNVYFKDLFSSSLNLHDNISISDSKIRYISANPKFTPRNYPFLYATLISEYIRYGTQLRHYVIQRDCIVNDETQSKIIYTYYSDEFAIKLIKYSLQCLQSMSEYRINYYLECSKLTCDADVIINRWAMIDDYCFENFPICLVSIKNFETIQLHMMSVMKRGEFENRGHGPNTKTLLKTTLCDYYTLSVNNMLKYSNNYSVYNRWNSCVIFQALFTALRRKLFANLAQMYHSSVDTIDLGQKYYKINGDVWRYEKTSASFNENDDFDILTISQLFDKMFLTFTQLSQNTELSPIGQPFIGAVTRKFKCKNTAFGDIDPNENYNEIIWYYLAMFYFQLNQINAQCLKSFKFLREQMENNRNGCMRGICNNANTCNYINSTKYTPNLKLAKYCLSKIYNSKTHKIISKKLDEFEAIAKGYDIRTNTEDLKFEMISMLIECLSASENISSLHTVLQTYNKVVNWDNFNPNEEHAQYRRPSIIFTSIFARNWMILNHYLDSIPSIDKQRKHERLVQFLRKEKIFEFTICPPGSTSMLDATYSYDIMK